MFALQAQGGSGMILGVDHPAIAVPDLQQALDFYCGVLGFSVAAKFDLPAGLMEQPFGVANAGCRVRMLHKGGTNIEVFEFQESLPGDAARPVNREGITHIALKSSDVPADYETLRAAGAKFNTPPQGEAPQRWCYGRDPFGNVIELLEAQ